MPAEEFKYFLTYSYNDSEFVIQLVKELRAAGANLWLDQLDILGGEHWDRAVEEALKNCKGMIAVLSPDSVASNNVMDEVSYALDEGKVVVPVLLRCCDVPLRLRRVHYVDFTTSYEKGFMRLLRALHIEQSASPPEPSAAAPPVCDGDAAPPADTPTQSLVHEEQAAGQIEKPLAETPATACSEPKDNGPMSTMARKCAGKLPPQDGQTPPGEAFDHSKTTNPEIRKTWSKRRRTAVFAAIGVVMSITIVSIGVLLKRQWDGQSEAGDIFTNSIGMNLVYIPSGEFMMGSSVPLEQLIKEFGSDEERYKGEFPRHEVRITRGFWMGQTEVTQSQYVSVMNERPWLGKEAGIEQHDAPAIWVTWDDATRFCRKLSDKEGKTYRLPTEAEWEYACRAGTTTRFSFGDSERLLSYHAWYNHDPGDKNKKFAHQVKQKKPNPWGLYDIHGNVWEWCSDWHKSDYYAQSPRDDPQGPPSGISRILRGGSAGLFQTHARCAFRDNRDPTSPIHSVGFRVVCTLPQQ